MVPIFGKVVCVAQAGMACAVLLLLESTKNVESGWGESMGKGMKSQTGRDKVKLDN